MEDANPYRKAHFSYPEPSSAVQQNPINRGKSYMNFLCKALFFALLIIILPLLPSQAPDFINESVITKFWELLHLLFIGIAVSYGLFSRRNVETDSERHSRIDNLQSDMSRMFHVSSFFDDGYENPYGSDEKRVSQSRNGHCFLGEEPRTFWSKGSTVIDEQCKPNLSFSENGVANSSAFDERNLIRAWNSQYFQGESMVVVAQPNLAVGEWGESRSGVDYKPLGLPVRSLKSRTRKCESPRFVNGSESGSDSQGSSTSSVTSRNGQFGDLGPQNLEREFHEAISSPSPIPWRSRSRSRMREMREQVSPATCPSHFRPLSVDEAQFESTKTRSSRSTVSFSSQASSISSSPKKSTSSDSISSEESNSKMEDAGKEKISEGSSSSCSPSPPKPMNDKVPSSSLHTRGYSYSSLDEKDPSPPKPVNGKVSSSALHSRGYSYSSLDEKDPSPPKPMNVKVSSSSLHARGYSYSSLDEKDPSPPKPMNAKVSSSALHSRGYGYSSLDEKDPSPPKPVNGKVSSSALHSRGYSYSSLDEKDPSPPRPMNVKVSSSSLHARGYSYSSLDEKDPSPPKSMNAKVSSSALHSRGYGYSSLDEKGQSPPKPMNAKVSSSSLHTRGYGTYSSLDEEDRSPPKPMNGKVSSSSLHARGYSYSSLDEKDPSPPKAMNGKVSLSSLHTRGYSYSSLDEKDPSPPKPMNGKVSSSALHARGYSYSSLDEKDPSPPKAMNDKVSLSALHLRGYSSLDDKDLRGSEVCLKDLGGGRGEKMKSASFSKPSPSRGKSVRTIRTSRMTDYGNMQGNQIGDQKVEKTCNNVETGYMRKKNGGIDNLGNGSGKQNLDNPIPCNMPKPTFSKNGKKEMEQFSGNVSVESEEDLESKAENVQVSSDGDAVSVNNSVTDSDEVDKKAGEFIAKFREQIRLQKTESMERSRGLRLANCFR